MIRLPLSSIAHSRPAVAAIATSIVVAMLFGIADLRLDSVGSAPHRADFTPDGGTSPSHGPSDLMSVMQGVVHVDLLGMHEKELSASAQPEKRRLKEVDDASLFSGIPITSEIKTRAKRSEVALVDTSSDAGSSALSWRSALRQMVEQQVADAEAITSQSTAGLAVVMLILLIGCTCLAAISIVYPNKHGVNEGHGGDVPYEVEPVAATVHEQRLSMLSNKQWTSNGPAWPQSQRAPGTGPWASAISPFTNALNPTPPRTFDHVPAAPVGADRVEEQPPSQDAMSRPPPLCPTLVMPICEARFGVPMFELAQLSAEGELNIVGLSGNPLLKAVVRKIGAARTLEISMPEQNSAPRATISPGTTELSGKSAQQGSRALEIRGMRGSFYGTLEMRSSGACYVVREGQTVLTIDGDAESLQLSIKSSVGLQFASVRCSAEPFDGVDHVEIRVEPGVDTVLVLSVVLAVLLLSPYLPPPEQ